MVKEVMYFEDDNGVPHKTREEAIHADAKIKYDACVDSCTVHGEFNSEEFLELLATDDALAAALATLSSAVRSKRR